MIENTAKRDSLVHLIGAMGSGSSGYIEEMERDGQRQLINSDRLPHVNRMSREVTDDDFIALGFIFGPDDPGDPLFRPAILPEGWTRHGSDHDMWSYIADERGIDRVSIFYKAAWYDRDAFMNLINVGRHYVSDLAYGDKPVFEVAVPWDLFTEEERAELVAGLRERVAECKKSDYAKEKGYDKRAAEALARFAPVAS